ncbi:DegV family protein [Peloplasma aerotolerans]|jgi:DegV family protein with EDD domain|uniref:DegV family protein n=1 Tax=Peloplasma aerotolerans TaxID=3044389 RepID=A0AAW6U3W5_9MOLU|nr:DegV family protein [Mariniplasma sp. M4Ah]MDI6452661.1 DegV family protein [Mariniplasma sp. M4Ah]
MKKTAILTCSNAGLDYLDYPKDIRILRSVIHFGTDESYDDFVQMDAKTFYERITKNPNDIPKTSYVSPGRMIEIFEELEKEGYEEALVITISSQLSGLYEAVKRIAKDVNIKVTVFDSLTLAYAEAYMVLEAHRLVEEEKTVEEIIKYLEKIRDNDRIYVAVDTLLYLVKNGRLSKLQGTLGTMLQLKPLLVLGDDGKVASLEKIRTTHKAQQRVLEKYIEDTKDLNVLTFISHAHNEEAVQWFKNELKKVFPEREVVSAYLTPVVGAHTGPKGIGLGYIKLD